jgi:acetylornithine deacetylase/succinyl-diaminopimelate desuccinylase-like protein
MASSVASIIKFPARNLRHPVDGLADRAGRRARPGRDAQTRLRRGLVRQHGQHVGRIGNGPRVLVYDSHIDTVGIGNPDEWDWDPFIGKIEKGRFYARGACDEKGSTPPMIYG